MAAREQTIEGVRPVLEALRAGRRRVLSISAPGRAESPGQRELEALAHECGVPVERSDAAGAGVVARAEPYPEEDFEALLTGPGPHFLVALDRVTDVGNLGSIARSAEVAGATGLALEQRRAPPIGPGALRASAGALEHLRVGRAPNLRKALELALAEGLAVLGADAQGARIESLAPNIWRGGFVWVFGSEDRGLRSGIRELATALVGIPRRGQVGSLGVAAAAAVLLHQSAELRERGVSQ